MIEVIESAAELQAPAKTLRELYERLAVHTGRVLTIERDYHGSLVLLTAELDQLRFQDSRGAESLSIGMRADRGESYRQLQLGWSYRVLVEGRWISIHSPLKDPTDGSS